MTDFIKIADALDKKHEGKIVSIRGWVYVKREMKDKIFLVIRDSSDIIQAVVSSDSKCWVDAQKITVESSVELEGSVYEDKRAPTGFEIKTKSLNIVGLAERFPITRDKSEEFLLDIRHLSLRTRKLTSTLKIRSTVMGALHEYLRALEYIEVEAPSFNAATSEGGSSTFECKYFDKKAYLTQSWQFYAENLISAFDKAYAMAPSFRAEKSRTTRHLTEFWHCEVEAAWANLNDVIEVAEGCVIYTIEKVLKNNKRDLDVLGVDIKKLEDVKAPFPRITYKEAIEKLQETKHKIKYGDDFGAKEEKDLAKYFNGNFVIVTNYPLEILKFYHGEDPENPGTGTNFNMLAPNVGEVVDGSQREPDIKKIQKRLKKAKMDLGASDWYLDSRRYGTVPHGGFGLGTERLTQWICGLEHIRDAIPFPRTINRLSP